MSLALPDLPARPVTGRTVRAARVLRHDAEVLQTARDVAAQLAPGAAARDRERRLPHEELDLVSGAGL